AQRVTAQAGCHDYGLASAGISLTTITVPSTGTTPAPSPGGGGGGGSRTVQVTQTIVRGRGVPVVIPVFGQVPVLQTGLTVSSGAIPVLVRGDITYLRQDFSVQLPITRPLPARPLNVRFDYLVRTWNITNAEAEKL